MKNKIYLLFLPLFLLACGVTTVQPTVTADPTKQPTHLPPHTDIAPPTAGYIGTPPVVARVCNVAIDEHVNARSEDAARVIAVLDYGSPVVYIGGVVEIGGEKWQETDQGLIDPKYLCEQWW